MLILGKMLKNSSEEELVYVLARRLGDRLTTVYLSISHCKQSGSPTYPHKGLLPQRKGSMQPLDWMVPFGPDVPG